MENSKYAIHTARNSIRAARKSIREKMEVITNEDFDEQAVQTKVDSGSIAKFLKLMKVPDDPSN